MKSIVTKMKNHQRDSKADFNEQKKESTNLKIGQWKLLRLRNRRKEIEEKQTVHKGPVRHRQVDQHTHRRSPKRKSGKEAEKIFEDIMAENFPNLRKYMNINI